MKDLGLFLIVSMGYVLIHLVGMGLFAIMFKIAQICDLK